MKIRYLTIGQLQRQSKSYYCNVFVPIITHYLAMLGYFSYYFVFFLFFPLFFFLVLLEISLNLTSALRTCLALPQPDYHAFTKPVFAGQYDDVLLRLNRLTTNATFNCLVIFARDLCGVEPSTFKARDGCFRAFHWSFFCFFIHIVFFNLVFVELQKSIGKVAHYIFLQLQRNV